MVLKKLILLKALDERLKNERAYNNFMYGVRERVKAEEEQKIEEEKRRMNLTPQEREWEDNYKAWKKESANRIKEFNEIRHYCPQCGTERYNGLYNTNYGQFCNKCGLKILIEGKGSGIETFEGRINELIKIFLITLDFTVYCPYCGLKREEDDNKGIVGRRCKGCGGDVVGLTDWGKGRSSKGLTDDDQFIILKTIKSLEHEVRETQEYENKMLRETVHCPHCGLKRSEYDIKHQERLCRACRKDIIL